MGIIVKVEILNNQLEIESKEFEAASTELIDVFQVVGSRKTQEGYEQLKCNVEAEGFRNPIILIPNINEYLMV